MRAGRAELTIEKLVAGGLGLARCEGEVVLVPRVAVGERVAVEIDRARRPAHGRLLRVLTPSEDRVEPACEAAARCGGCDWIHLTAGAQRRARLLLLRDALPEELREAPVDWSDATPAHARTRARLHARSVGEAVLVGFHGLGSHTVVNVDACPALDPRLSASLEDVRALLFGARGEGEVQAALGEGGRPTLVVGWHEGELPASTFGEAERRVSQGRLAGVEVAIAGARTPARIGDPRVVWTGDDGLPMRAPAAGFAQASEVGDAVLVSTVRARARAAGARVVELFAGSGNFTVPLARDATSVTAVEVVAEACRAARENLAARALGARVKLVEADAEAVDVPRRTDLVVLDPPRTGARGACDRIAASTVPRVVYVSCDPPTLGRDLRVLLRAGFRVTSIDALDLFPDTSHLETVVALERAR